MSKYTLTTRECSLDSLSPALSAAMRAHVAHYQLGNIEPEILMCCETISTMQKTGLFSSGVETTRSAIFVTPQWLVWAASTDGKKASTGSAQLRNIDVHDYEQSAMYAITPHAGFNITGRYTDGNQTGQTFIDIGADQAGKKFREVLYEKLELARQK